MEIGQAKIHHGKFSLIDGKIFFIFWIFLANQKIIF